MALSIALPLLSACYSLQVVRPENLERLPHGTAVSITRPDHSTIALDSARVLGDSVVGWTQGLEVQLPLSATVVRVREPSPARTAALVVAASGSAAVATYFLVIKPSNNGTTCNIVGAFLPCAMNGCCNGSIP